MFSEGTWEKINSVKGAVLEKVFGRKHNRQEQEYDYLENRHDVEKRNMEAEKNRKKY